MGATLFSGHFISGYKFSDRKLDWKIRLLINYLNLNNTGQGSSHNNMTMIIHVFMQIFKQFIENFFCASCTQSVNLHIKKIQLRL